MLESDEANFSIARNHQLEKDSLKLLKLINILEQIKDAVTPIVDVCSSNGLDQLNEIKKCQELMCLYQLERDKDEEFEELKKRVLNCVVENEETDLEHANSSISVDSSADISHVQVDKKKKKRKNWRRKTKSKYMPLKKGRVGRPRKEEWALFEQEKMMKATFVCTWEGCDKRYYHNSHLINHLRMHSGERPFICEWPGCGKRYLTNSILVSHVRSAHMKVQQAAELESSRSRLPYKCELCCVDFRRRDQLDTHLSSVHASEKPLRCDWPGCDFQTVHSQKLKMHKMRHTGEKPYKCNWPSCEWSFRQQHHLKTHMLKHTGEKPHGCDWPGCERRFQSRQALRIHVERTHNNNDLKNLEGSKTVSLTIVSDY